MSNQNQYKFKEGEIHPFKITGFTEMPGTDESFYILENPFGGKHLLKSVHYKHYNLELNHEVICKIDKINCSGKIYLEPENPIYKEGEIYNFTFVKLIEQLNSVGEKEKAAVVKNQFNEDVICSLPKDCQLSGNIKNLQCKVLRIKKGELYLAIPEIQNKKPKIGKNYWFDLIDMKPLENNIEHYILRDEFGNLYSLKKDMYQHYGFKTGQKIQCTVTKYNADAHLKIEPIHPHYQIGESYLFKYLYSEEDLNPLGEKEIALIVEDFYGVETKVRTLHSNKIPDPIPEYINCKVDGIRKGKAILSLA